MPCNISEAVLLGSSQRAGTSFDITFVHLDDPKHQVHDLVKTRCGEGGPVFSPDGAWVAYVSDESGRGEVYVVDFPNAARKLQVSRNGGGDPIWRLDGREIYFRQSEVAMAAPVTRGGTESRSAHQRNSASPRHPSPDHSDRTESASW